MSKPAEITEMMQTALKECQKIDILVNNAYKGVQTIFSNIREKFWQSDPTIWDDINNVGLRY